MSRNPSTWLKLARKVGQALLELLGAEISALCEELELSGRRLLGAVILLSLALFALFWGVGALSLTVFELLALRYARWQASLFVLGGLLTVAAVLAAIGWWRLRTIEAPAATVRRRLDDHLSWWQGRILAADGEEPRSGSDSDQEI